MPVYRKGTALAMSIATVGQAKHAQKHQWKGQWFAVRRLATSHPFRMLCDGPKGTFALDELNDAPAQSGDFFGILMQEIHVDF